MEAPKNANTRNITISGNTVTMHEPFSEGQQLTLDAGTAHALNQTLAENLRNNTAEKIKSEPDRAQEIFNEAFASYQFGVRSGGGGGTRDPIQTEALNLARAAIKAACKKRNREVPAAKDLTEQARALVAKDKRFTAQAKKVVEARSATAEVDLEEAA